MNFEHSSKVKDLQTRLTAFMDEHVYAAERQFEAEMDAARRTGNAWQPAPVMETLKEKAKAAGLWNLFLPESQYGAGLTNLEYAPLCEIMGRSSIGAEPFNCSAPDTGNMETLVRYGSAEQQQAWLIPLLDGTIRSGFAMTEPAVASSDATNIAAHIARDGDHYVINARKWWTSGANDPRCKILIFMGKTAPDHPDAHRRQSMILVPMDTPGVSVLRHLPVFGYDDAPHGHAEVLFENVRVPVGNALLGEGRGFEIAQGRLGPGRIHHCMRLIGRAERALEAMCRRASSRVAFGRRIADYGVTRERIAQARILIDQARFLVLHAAWKMDTHGNKAARKEIAMIKVAAPEMACQVIDWAIQVHGAGGVSEDFGLARAYAGARTLRLADGPDEVHRNAIAKLELGAYL
ncbi:acyl-CoA dehydrogenase family protein [Paraburkholderia sp. J63]|uniref:acyl-CoA dehydrogenase family protein n=1 Tax=Paraburkholderia sp. J63 TaxID=2805434 RepID=UPI002ABE0759|nr:acyl-CoA dehydrogenase family protein [Paraburkholderia sp. J63]